MQIISASEARQAVKQTKEYSDKQLTEVDMCIRKAAKAGYTQLNVKELTDDNAEILIQNGFNVYYPVEVYSSYKISW